MRNKRLAIIPARGGSKRIPQKNIKPFLGKPIIAYPIDTALRSELFSEVMVSTDDEEIASVATSYGAEVPFMRSAETSTDHSTIAEVVLEVIKKYKENGQHFDIVCCIFATAPFVTAKRLSEGLKKLDSGSYSSVYTVQEFDYPIWRGLKMDSKGMLELLWPEYLNTRSQDLPIAYHDAGQFYWAKVSNFERNKTFMSTNSTAIVLQRLESIDIDSPEDWAAAEQIFGRWTGE